MRYLRKIPDSKIVQEGWHYRTSSHRPHIRRELLREQQGYCAYTERYVEPLDSCDIEHFDNRLKGQSEDDYWNWYAVHHWANMQKRSIEQFLPILLPHDPTMAERVVYKAGQFQPVDPNDLAAKNLIAFLKWNDPTVAEYRSKFIRRVKDLRMLLNDDVLFLAYLREHPEECSFITVLEAELGLSLGETRTNFHAKHKSS